MTKPLPVAIEELQDIPLFHDLSPVQLRMLCALTQRASFSNNEKLLTFCEQNQRVYFLQSGTVKICLSRIAPARESDSDKEHPALGQKLAVAGPPEEAPEPEPEQQESGQVVLNLCGPGEVLGEMSCIDGQGHSADVVALEPCRTLWIEGPAFHDCVHQMPALALALLHNTQRRFRFATRLLKAHSMLDVTGRIACLLLLFSERYGQETPEGETLIPLRILQRDLADMVGASRTRTNLALTLLRESGEVANASGSYLMLRDTKALACRCC